MQTESEPVDVKIVRVDEFLKVQASGKLDFDGSLRLLVDVIFAAGEGTPDDILIDLRRADWSSLSVSELFDLVLELWKQPRATAKRLAFVESPDHDQEKSELARRYAQSRGIRFETFLDFEEALAYFTHHRREGAEERREKQRRQELSELATQPIHKLTP